MVDLVFREKQGWVIVDYKTDAAAKRDVAPLVERYRPQIERYRASWERITGDMVEEAGLYLVLAFINRVGILPTRVRPPGVSW